jgi:endonuclease/exonuclease/phosphatase (EEP) superfamily protein YafD
VGWLAAAVWVGLASAWLWSGTDWLVDLVANLAAQVALGAGVFALYWLVRRKWSRMVVAIGATALAMSGIVSAPRAERAPANSDGVVRVLTMNAYAWNRDPSGLMALLEGTSADVVTIFEPPSELLQALRTSESLLAKYPERHLPDGAETGMRVMLSRWPAERLRKRDAASGEEEGGEWRSHGRSWRIDAPAPFVLSMIHPESPRSREAWVKGNGDVERADRAFEAMLEPLGLPIVLAGDFNSTPSGWRSRELSRRLELRRTKPWWTPEGTWPSSSFWPVRVAIDDVMVSDGVEVVSWRPQRTPPTGQKGLRNSDHVPVLVELLLPAP